MADLVTLKRIQYYIPGLTEYRFKIARRHRLEYGRGVPLPLNKSPRMRVDSSQLDHFLTFITSQHVIQDLPFGQRYLRLSSGKLLETPNVIRTMIPQAVSTVLRGDWLRAVWTYNHAACFVRMLCNSQEVITGSWLHCCRGCKSLRWSVCHVVARLEECGLASHVGGDWQKSLKAAKQYLNSDYKVMTNVMKIKEHQLYSFTLWIYILEIDISLLQSNVFIIRDFSKIRIALNSFFPFAPFCYT